MSSGGFKENFERGEKDSLDYDDSAFYYFGLALLVVSVVPLTWILIIKPIFYGDIAVNYMLKNCKCFICEERIQKRSSIYKFSWFNAWFVVKLLIVIGLWVTTFKCYEIVKDVEPLKTFIPNEILGVETDATVAQVKKAYRKLSREKHPDKNPDNPNAVEEFISITKAYTIMTDEKARENFLKYGNPDGKGSMAVGIALPRFLQDVDYQIQVLIVFFVVVIFLVPAFFLSQIKANEQDVGGVDIDNRKIFTEMINENMLMKHIPGILAYSVEFSQMKVRSQGELDILKRIKQMDAVKEAIPKGNEKRGPPQVKPICLLMAHMYSALEPSDHANEGISADLEKILRTVPSFFDIMLSQIMMLAQFYKMGRSPKKITARNIMTLIQFSQNLMQGGWVNKDPYAQLPDFKDEQFKNVRQVIPGKTFYQYCMMEKQERKQLAPEIYGPSYDKQFQEQEKCIEAMPLVKLTMTAFVQGEDEVVVGDILTCKLKVEYLKLKDGERSGYVHSKNYPFLKKDNWFLIITDENFMGLAAVEKLQVTGNVYEKEFKERIQRPGKISFTAILTNDSYKGLDQSSKVEVEVVAEAKNRSKIDYSKEDIKAIKEGGLIQQALMGEEETDEDEDDDVDEATELANKLKSLGYKGEETSAETKKDQ